MDELPINRIILGDCREVMRSLPKKCIDLLLTDPPYNISNDAEIVRNGGKFGVAKSISMNFGEWDRNVIMPNDWVPRAIETLTENGVFISFYDKRHISHLCDLLEENGCFIRHIGTWHKLNPAPQARKVKWQIAGEMFVIATKNKGTGHHYNYKEGQHHDVITTPICQGNERYDHPTQKPEALINPLIKWWSFEGDVVFDPFCGTGTIPAVAKKLGRRFIGVENDERYFSIAKARVDVIQAMRLTSFLKEAPLDEANLVQARLR